LPASQKRINADRLSYPSPYENPPDSIGAEHALAALGWEVRNLFSNDDPQQNRPRPIPLSRTVATIASVALDRKITEQMVRGVRC
jgi:hypothetical protein